MGVDNKMPKFAKESLTKESQTKEVIVSALMSLLGEKPADRITVKDIVERCGVNRNTFYYHFHDIPDAVDYAMRRELRRLFDQEHFYQSITDALLHIVDYLEMNSHQVLHIYRSMKRESFIRYMRDAVGFLVEQLAAHIEKSDDLTREETEAVGYFCRCLIEGILLDWMDSGMKEDVRAKAVSLIRFLSKNLEVNEVIARILTNGG